MLQIRRSAGALERASRRAYDPRPMRHHRLTIPLVAAIVLAVVIATLLLMMFAAPSGTALAGAG